MQIIKKDSGIRKDSLQSWVVTYESTPTSLSSDENKFLHGDQVLRLSFGFKAKDKIAAEQHIKDFAAAWFITRESVVSLKPLNNVIEAGTKLLEEKDEEKNLA